MQLWKIIHNNAPFAYMIETHFPVFVILVIANTDILTNF